MEVFSGRCLMRTTVVLLLLTAITIRAVSGDADYGAKRVVRVQNDLGPGVTLNVHCSSKDEDLGIHDLQDGEYTEWSFQVSFIKNIRFGCIIQWKNDKEYNFDAFTTKRDMLRCAEQCWWSIKTDGGYSYNEYFKKYEKLYTWS